MKFTASRFSKGNFFFPPEIHIIGSSIKIVNRDYGRTTYWIAIADIEKAYAETPNLGYSKLIIMVRAIPDYVLHGFTVNQIDRIRAAISTYRVSCMELGKTQKSIIDRLARMAVNLRNYDKPKRYEKPIVDALVIRLADELAKLRDN